MVLRIGTMILAVSLLLPSMVVHAAPAPLSLQLSELKEYIDRLISAGNPAPLTDDELRSSIKAGAQWLTRAQELGGHFMYEYHPYEDTYSDDDNIVRQAGALFALGEILRRDSSDPFTIETNAINAIKYFESISQKGELNDQAFRCVAYHEKSTRCPLGATSLALIGILSLVEANPEMRSQYRDLIDEYQTFILAMQKKNGGFRNVFRTDTESQSETESPFSNGEALLALARLYQYDADPALKNAITAALSHLTKQPYDTALYLWIMAALKDIGEIDTTLSNVPYARSFTLWRIEHGKYQRSSAQNFCAYTEGVVSALSILNGKISKEEYAHILTEGDRGIRTNQSLQLTTKDGERAFITSGKLSVLSLEEPRLGVGGFLTGEQNQTQRIDYTQHCISASLQMLTDVREAALDT